MGFFGEIARDFSVFVAENKNISQYYKRIKESIEWEEKWKQKLRGCSKDLEELHKNIEQSERKNYEQKKMVYEINKIWEPILKETDGTRDFSKLDDLPEMYRDSDFLRTLIFDLKDWYYRKLVNAYYEDKLGVSTLLAVIHDLLYFKEIKDEVEYSLRHFDYFLRSRKYIQSTLTGCENIEEELNSIRSNLEFYDKLSDEGILTCAADAKKLYEDGQYEAAFNKIVNADRDELFFEEVKRTLLFLAMQEADDMHTELYDIMQEVNDAVFKPIEVQTLEDGELKLIHIKTVDMIIAKSLKYAKVNIIDNINEELTEFLYDFAASNKDKVDIEQYEVLRKVFAYLQAYKQEAMVLESMAVHNVPLTALQEKRLAFLRSDDVKNMPLSMQTHQGKIKLEDGQLTYEYQILSWNTDELKRYFDMLTVENKTPTIPMVIDEWNKNLELRNLNWNNNSLKEYLEKRIAVHFGERFVVQAMETGALVDGEIDFSSSILISEPENGIYPWIAFIITGEQLTLSQVTFSIYIIYIPEQDLLDESNTVDRNRKMLQKVATLKLKRNPKINNYFKAVNSVLVTELENWINDNQTENIYS